MSHQFYIRKIHIYKLGSSKQSSQIIDVLLLTLFTVNYPFPYLLWNTIRLTFSHRLDDTSRDDESIVAEDSNCTFTNAQFLSFKSLQGCVWAEISFSTNLNDSTVSFCAQTTIVWSTNNNNNRDFLILIFTNINFSINIKTDYKYTA